MRIRLATGEDADAIATVYAPFVTDSAISLEEEAPTAAEMRTRIAAGGTLHPWLAAEVGGRVAGYASASRFRPRHGYRFTVETSVYVAPGAHGVGIGRGLYTALIDLLVKQGFTQAIAAITLPNAASIRLHEAMGFVGCGTYRQVGWKLGHCWDVGLWQRALADAGDPPREPIPYAQVDS